MTQTESNRKYRLTPKGCLMRAYEFAKRRICEGRGLYLGLGICDRADFCKAFEKDPRFLQLHQEWADSGYRKSERPTPDRIDTKRGYLVDNIVWEPITSTPVAHWTGTIESEWSKYEYRRLLPQLHS